MRTALYRELTLHLPLLGIVAVYVAAARLLFGPLPPNRSLPVALVGILWFGWGSLVVLTTCLQMVRREVEIHNLFAALVGRVFAALLTVGTMVPFMAAFSLWKMQIAYLHPFAFDRMFTTWDRFLHFGRLPWEWLHPFADARRIALLDGLYFRSWFFVFLAVLILQAWSGKRVRRQQFLLTWVSMWILIGTVLAVGLSSAGPAFYAAVVGGQDPYAPLLSQLVEVHQTRPLDSVRGFEYLWRVYESGDRMLGGGISAMPSMHIALAVLVVILVAKSYPLLAVPVAGWALVILLGAVYLGWHYAVDAYASILLVPIIWWGSAELSPHFLRG